MARRRYIQNSETGELVEVALDYQAPPKNADHVLWNDRAYDGLQATDGTAINSRSRHREYMKAHNLTLMDDFKGTWQKSREQRDAYFKEGKGGATRREDVARAIATLERMRPNSGRR